MTLVQFVPDQDLAAVFCGKALYQTLSVFKGAFRQIGCDACVERPVTLVGHDIDAGLFHAPISQLFVIARSVATTQSTLSFAAWIASLRSQ
jgi:hypothetical protein